MKANVRSMRLQLGVGGTRWTDTQTARLREYVIDPSRCSDIYSEMPERSKSAVEAKIKKIRSQNGKVRSFNFFTSEDDDEIQSGRATGRSFTAIAEALNPPRSADSVRKRFYKLSMQTQS